MASLPWHFCLAAFVSAMSIPLERIVAGGQTGVDQAALAVAHDLGLATGGWCPSGYVDENGPIGPMAEAWHLKALPTTVWDEHQGFFESLKISFNSTDIWARRTLMNALESSGTLTILPKATIIVDGTNLGIQVVKALKKPLLVLGAVWRSEDIKVFKTWLQENDIRVLNINGPRESSAPGIHLECKTLFRSCSHVW